MRLPNILHESVPAGKDANGNVVIKEWGKKPKFDFELKPHGELLQDLGMANFEKAAEVSGSIQRRNKHQNNNRNQVLYNKYSY